MLLIFTVDSRELFVLNVYWFLALRVNLVAVDDNESLNVRTPLYQ